MLYTGLDIHDGHTAFAVDTPAWPCHNTPELCTIYRHKWPVPFLFGAAVP